MPLPLTVSGCGSGDKEPESGGEKGDSSASASPTTSYFGRADTNSINAVVVKAQQTGQKAQSPKEQAACNKASDQGYQAWRTCWHNLLDPLQAALTGIATELGTLAERDFPKDCVTSLEAAEAAFTGFAAKIEGLLAGIDSKRRAAQVRALKTYSATLGELAKSFVEPFRPVTQACYSPEDLAKLKASARPSPSPSN